MIDVLMAPTMEPTERPVESLARSPGSLEISDSSEPYGTLATV